MGDRGNIVVRQGKTSADDVWFYTHWSGSNIESVLKKALSRKQRWSDSSYLARIIFDELTKGNQGDETGFGISCQVGDNEYPIVVCDIPNQKVYSSFGEDFLVKGRLPGKIPSGESFESFIK